MTTKNIFISTIALLFAAGLFVFAKIQPGTNDKFLTYTINPKKQNIKLYWKDDTGKNFKSIQNLKQWLQNNGQQLVFAMNGGMYKTDNAPLGLYIEDGKILSGLNKANGSGNFYLKPNGVFYISKDGVPDICTTAHFTNNGKIRYATQSGPMLVIDGQIHPSFTKGSANLNTRNGVGILPGNKVVFVMSKQEVSLYDLAAYFKSLGCTNALYLDGFVSRTYLPEQHWEQTDGNFGVIIGVTNLKK